MNYLILPGNPPAVHYYRLWEAEIARAMPGARARTSPYPHLRLSRDPHAAMDEVTANHAEQLKRFADELNGPVTLIGHSLGAHFALRLLERHPDRVRATYLLHPFLRRPAPRGRVILGLMSLLYGRERLQKLLIGSRRVLEQFSTELVHVTDEEITKSFHLARHESRTIGRDSSAIVFDPALHDRVRVFYAQNDIWCRPETLSPLAGKAALYECSEPHGFITEERHRQSLFRRILEIERRSLG